VRRQHHLGIDPIAAFEKQPRNTIGDLV
jgi:hypothetical protein